MFFRASLSCQENIDAGLQTPATSDKAPTAEVETKDVPGHLLWHPLVTTAAAESMRNLGRAGQAPLPAHTTAAQVSHGMCSWMPVSPRRGAKAAQPGPSQRRQRGPGQGQA